MHQQIGEKRRRLARRKMVERSTSTAGQDVSHATEECAETKSAAEPSAASGE